MTSSDATALPPGAAEALAARAGTTFVPEPAVPSGSVAIAGAQFNGGITARLLAGALTALEKHGVDRGAVTVAWAPGAFELPLVARRFATGPVSAVVALGAVIRGDTAHFDFVAGPCAAALQQVMADTGVPVVFGVLTTDTVAQALERSGTRRDQQGVRGRPHRPEDGRPGPAPGPLPGGRLSDGETVLQLVLPKGSLEKATLELFAAADLTVSRSSQVDYRASIADPRIDEVRILRPQEIPTYVADGLFDLGTTGRDWIEETGAEVVSIGELEYSKATPNPIRVVLAVGGDSPFATVADLPQGARVSTEYPELTRRFLEKNGIHADVRLSYGATEAKVPDIADAVVEITETGRALKAAGLRVIDTLLVSRTELVANPVAAADPVRRHAMGQILTLLQGALEARGKVLLKLNVGADRRDAVIAVLPSLKAPTVSALHVGRRLRRGDGGAEVRGERPHPRAERPRRHRHHRGAAVQDRPLRAGRPGGRPTTGGPMVQARRGPRMVKTGTVAEFDEARGLGVLEADDGHRYPFHCTAIADGSRRIDEGTRVFFSRAAGHLGRIEARSVQVLR